VVAPVLKVSGSSIEHEVPPSYSISKELQIVGKRKEEAICCYVFTSKLPHRVVRGVGP